VKLSAIAASMPSPAVLLAPSAASQGGGRRRQQRGECADRSDGGKQTHAQREFAARRPNGAAA
jgi:hypothetical protein